MRNLFLIGIQGGVRRCVVRLAGGVVGFRQVDFENGSASRFRTDIDTAAQRVDRRDRMSQAEPLVFRIFLGREEWVENTRQGIGFDTDAGSGNDDNPVCRLGQRLAETDQGMACDFIAGDLFNGYGKDSAELLVAAFFFHHRHGVGRIVHEAQEDLRKLCGVS